jgi:superfamily II DNA or RNA helicase
MEQIRKILGKVDRLIIFYNLDYELEILRMLHTELDIPVAEWNGHRHQDIPNSEKWVFLVQYQAGSEGWNCISTNHILFYSLPYSYRWLEQAMGRIDRLNTPFRELHYHILKSRSKFDQGIDKRLRRKKNFNVAAFAKSIWPKADSREEGRMMKPPV